MMDTGEHGEPTGEDATALTRLFGSAPRAKPREKKHYRAKVYRSGNSFAIRMPAGPTQRLKRKFDIAKVAGLAANLQFVSDENRLFEERPLLETRAKRRPNDLSNT